MAINNFSQAGRNKAVPLPPTTSSATTSATTTDVTITWTKDTNGTQPTDFLVTGTSTTGITTTATVPASESSVIIKGQTNNTPYTFSVSSKNLYGISPSISPAPVTPPVVYKQGIVARTTQNYIIPPRVTKIAAVVYGGGGTGGSFTSTNSDPRPNFATGVSGRGGGGAGAVTFQNYTVTPGETYLLTVAAAEGTSTITTPGSTVIAQANNGQAAFFNTGGAGGTATSTVAGSATATGGAGGAGQVQGSNASVPGGLPSATVLTNLTATGLVNPLTTVNGGGGAGGPIAQFFSTRYGGGQYTSTGGTAYGTAVSGANGSFSAPGNGGGGGGFVTGSLRTGGAGGVIIYVS